MLNILNDTCYYIARRIEEREYTLENMKFESNAQEVRYDIAIAQVKLDHYTKMYHEYKKYGYIEDKEAKEIELEEKLEEIKLKFYGEDDEEYEEGPF